MNPKPGSIDISNAAERLGLALSTVQAGQVANYLGLLVTYNQRMNLVGKSDWRTIFETLVIDSIHLAGFLEGLELPAEPLSLDLGAGAGLPGIPLRILWNQGQYWLVEVRLKRCSFMRTAVGRLKLAGTHVFEGRAEDALQQVAVHAADHAVDYKQKPRAGLILSRAFMPWDKLLPFVRPMLAPQGRLVVLANEMPPKAGAFVEGWTVEATKSYAVGPDTRWFWSLYSV